MSSSVVLVPGAPVLVPELSGSAAGGTARFVGAILDVLRKAGEDADHVHVVGTDPLGRVLGDVRSTLGRWGAEVEVGRVTSPPAAHGAVPDTALIAWWLLDRAGLDHPRSFTGLVGGPRAAPPAVEAGPVVVVADGPASLTPRAPVPEDPRGVDLDARLARWLRDGGALPDPGAAVAEEIGWWSRPAWLVAEQLVSGRGADESFSLAPFGVGYHCAWWRAEGEAS